MNEAPEDQDSTVLPRELRFLKGLVTILTVAMIGGVITITGLLVIRLNAEPAPVVVAIDAFALPDGVQAVGLSIIDGRTVIVGDDGVIRVFDSITSEMLQEIAIGD